MRTAAVCGEELKPSLSSFRSLSTTTGSEPADKVAGKVKYKGCTAFLSCRPLLLLLRAWHGRLQPEAFLQLCRGGTAAFFLSVQPSFRYNTSPYSEALHPSGADITGGGVDSENKGKAYGR
jgi:hypothetical protein